MNCGGAWGVCTRFRIIVGEPRGFDRDEMLGGLVRGDWCRQGPAGAPRFSLAWKAHEPNVSREKKEGPPSAKSKERRKRRLAVLREGPGFVDRRRFVAQGTVLCIGGSAASAHLLLFGDQNAQAAEGPPVRPPSASAIDVDFRLSCVRCGLCGTVCENGCIQFFGVEETRYGALTPYLDVRHRACTLCMRCTQICPTGALSPLEDDQQVIGREVRMGTAVVDPERCLSYLGRLCGYCHDACPLPEQSIKLVPPALPVVLDDCVGCGRCVEECPQTPTAIRVERKKA